MNDAELTLDELMDVIAVLTHLRCIFPVVHQEEHWTVPGPAVQGSLFSLRVE